MPPPEFRHLLRRTLLYYEIFDHPLTADEIFYLFPANSLSRVTMSSWLDKLTDEGLLSAADGFFQLNGRQFSKIRAERHRRARRRMRIARFMAHIIKRFPFVRAVFISGDLSKGVANPRSDIDYVIITSPGRLWITRTLLMLFKKLFLLNSKKYFCLNYYIDTECLTLQERNYYTATEIAHLKPLFNMELYLRYLNANNWIKEFFPNYQNCGLNSYEANNRKSLLQRFFEIPFSGHWADSLERSLMHMMIRVWARRYPQYDARTRAHIFRSSEHESRAYVGNFSQKVMALYDAKLHEAEESGDAPRL